MKSLATENRGNSAKRAGAAFRPAAVAIRWSGRRSLAQHLCSALLLGFLPAAAHALDAGALPSGGQVAAGSANIRQSGSRMVVQQDTPKIIIDWRRFDIGADASVDFLQPDRASVALNRVSGGNPSRIFGRLGANGQVYLINAAGVLFARGSQVDVGGLTASTLNIRNDDFLAGRLVFRRDGSTGSVVNQGSITAADGGQVVLLGSRVRNEGLIRARLGQVALAAGETVTLSAGAGGHLQVAVDPATIDALAENSELIQADGGQVVLTARAAGELLSAVVSNQGIVQARSIENRDGRIFLLGDGRQGETVVSGTLDASGKAAGGRGGTVAVLGDRVGALDGARIDVSGDAGGGTALIGGNYQGQGPERNATVTAVGADASIHADAVTRGDGGKVVVWADDTTKYYGTISAKGGAAGGNGGTVETSGKRVLDMRGKVDASAAAGAGGKWLLDPNNVTIQAAGPDANVTGNPDFITTGDDAVVTTGSIEAALDGGTDVTVTTGSGGADTQQGNITVADAVIWSSANTLTLQAANDIAINADIAAGNGGLTLSAAHAVSATGAIQTRNFTLQQGNWSQIDASLPGFQVSNDFRISGTGTFARFTGGTGAAGTPYVIADVFGLQGMTSLSGGNSYSLGADIDASVTAHWNGGAGFAPVGTITSSFIGAFDGNGHTIDGIFIHRPSTNYVGLFGVVGNDPAVGSIGNVHLENVNVTGNSNTGGLAGGNYGTVTNCSVTGSVNGNQRVGGLVGDNYNAVTDSYSNASASGVSFVGGLIGSNYIGFVTGSHSTGPVTGTSQDTGGLIGFNWNAPVSHSYNTGSVSGGSGNPGSTGGLIGINMNSAISDSYNTGAVDGGAYNGIGGLVGTNSGASGITRSYNTGAVGGKSWVGGLIGENTSSAGIMDSYNTGAVIVTNGSSQAGGLIGRNIATGSIINTYSTGAVICTGTCSATGGLIGYNSGSTVANSYWDTQTSGRTSSSGGMGRTTAQMMAQATFSGWDFGGTWGIVEGRSDPYLQGQFSGTPQVVSGTAYSDRGTTGLGGATVTGLVDGAEFGVSATTGVNGYYNLLVAPGTIPASDGEVLVYLTGATKGNAFRDGAAGSIAGLDVYGGYLRLESADPALSGMESGLATALGPHGGSDFLGAVGGGGLTLAAGANLEIDSTAATLNLDRELNAGGGILVLNSAGTVTQSAAFSAAGLELLGTTGNFVLDAAANNVAAVAGNTGSVRLQNDGSLTVGTVGASDGLTAAGAVRLIAAGADADITLDRAVTSGAAGDSVVLASGRNFVNNAGAGGINAAGRWLVYSSDPQSDARGGLAYGFKQYDARYGDPVLGSGNGFLYAVAPVLTAGLTGTVTKGYDGTASAAVAAGNYAFVGQQPIDGDTVNITGAGGAAYADKNAGTGKIVTANGLTVQSATDGSGAAVYGYQLASTGASGAVGTITRAALTVSAGDVTKSYDGTTAAAGTAAVTGGTLFGGDSLSGGTFAFTDKNAGSNKVVTVGGVTVGDGVNTDNYDVTFVSNTTGTIPPRVVDLTGARTYDGTAVVDAGIFTIGHLVGAETLALTGSGTVSDKNAGSGKTVAPGTLALGDGSNGGLASNYTIVGGAHAAGIAPALLTVGLTGTVLKTYDGTTAAPLAAGNYTVSGIVGGDEVSLDSAAGFYDTKDAGAGKAVTATGLTLAGNDAGNYLLAATGVSGTIGAIDPADLAIAAENQRKYQGQENPPLTFLVGGTGLAAGDSAADVFSGELATDAVPDSPTGEYAITQGALAVNGNYRIIAFADGVLQVLEAASPAEGIPIDGGTLLRLVRSGAEWRNVTERKGELRLIMKPDYIPVLN